MRSRPGLINGGLLSLWPCGQAPRRSSRATARAVSARVLAQSAAGTLAYLGTQSRAPGRDTDHRYHGASVKRHLLPAPRQQLDRTAAWAARLLPVRVSD